MLQLSDADQAILDAVAADRGMTPGEWLSSLALAKLEDAPRWNQDESRALANIVLAAPNQHLGRRTTA